MVKALTVLEEVEAVVDLESLEFGWKTTLFNCECHTFDDVIGQLIKAINCTETRASQLASAVHHLGHVVVCQGEKKYCQRAADILGSIGLRVDVSKS